MKNLNALVAFMAVSPLCFTFIPSLSAAEREPGDKVSAQAWASVTKAIAILHPTSGNKCQGQVRFTQDGDKVKVEATMKG